MISVILKLIVKFQMIDYIVLNYFFKYADIMDDDILERIAEEEVLIKFKFREEAGKKLFIMTIHYPDDTKDPWTWVWREN